MDGFVSGSWKTSPVTIFSSTLQAQKSARFEFKDENLPFILVQLPSFGEPNSQSLRSWVDFKLAQDQIAAEMPNTEIISKQKIARILSNSDNLYFL